MVLSSVFSVRIVIAFPSCSAVFRWDVCRMFARIGQALRLLRSPFFGAELTTAPEHPDADGTVAAVPAAVANAVVVDPVHAKPAVEVTTDSGVVRRGSSAASVSVGQCVSGASGRHRTAVTWP